MVRIVALWQAVPVFLINYSVCDISLDLVYMELFQFLNGLFYFHEPFVDAYQGCLRNVLQRLC